MKVRMSDDARSYLRNEAKYLRKHSPAAAKALTDAMRKARENLTTFGELGFAKEGLPIPGMRRLIVENYLLDYEIVADVILVVTIRHGRQMPPEMPPDDDFDFEG
jgi:plasmid stabilization system protein ParE